MRPNNVCRNVAGLARHGTTWMSGSCQQARTCFARACVCVCVRDAWRSRLSVPGLDVQCLPFKGLLGKPYVLPVIIFQDLTKQNPRRHSHAGAGIQAWYVGRRLRQYGLPVGCQLLFVFLWRRYEVKPRQKRCMFLWLYDGTCSWTVILRRMMVCDDRF